MKTILLVISFFFLGFFSAGQSSIGNYVSNGSFEALNSNSLTTAWNIASYWAPIDSNGYYCSSGIIVTTLPPISNAPYFQGYQYARTGNNYCLGTMYCPGCAPPNPAYLRFYPFNRLKRKLSGNRAYCVKFHVVNANINALGIDSYGAYFGDSSLDTITTCRGHLTYLQPQVKNQTGNIITDTLRWVPITGTFVATGNEKYLILGNFNTEAATNSMVINTATYAVQGTDICIDDVSVIEMNLPAYAGRDTTILPGQPVFLGREPDFAIDSGCVWYKWPNMTVPIDTISGFLVNPTTTSTYIVKQTLDCSPEKWDTVVVTVDATVGMNKLKIQNEEFELFPNPADDYLEIKIKGSGSGQFNHLRIYNSLGQLIREEIPALIPIKSKIGLAGISEGVYFLQLTGSSGTVRKRFVIAR